MMLSPRKNSLEMTRSLVTVLPSLARSVQNSRTFSKTLHEKEVIIGQFVPLNKHVQVAVSVESLDTGQQFVIIAQVDEHLLIAFHSTHEEGQRALLKFIQIFLWLHKAITSLCRPFAINTACGIGKKMWQIPPVEIQWLTLQTNCLNERT